ncbi:MAG: dynamin family protein, partial [Bacteroidales bacterium]|nr:dynamin family protein [Bacteroidales bacterium]
MADNNIFEELQSKKQHTLTLIQKAETKGWISADEAERYRYKIANDVLTIGVIGQMKAGKSTFLNAFVFEDDVLPAAVTPMTAALTVITYGDEKKLEAEFYSREEWEEQLMTAQMNPNDAGSDSLRMKILAAKELVEKSQLPADELDTLLGSTKEDSFDKLTDYVGADGRFVSITKAVTLYWPAEYLRGVRIVDTPGFNDPIVAREQRTIDFLQAADVVLLMLYAGRPFDANDREILFKHIGACGIGRVLIGINKYDIPFGNGETENEIGDYVVKQIQAAASATGNHNLDDLLLDAKPIPLSAEMALLARLPMSRINADERYSFAWKRHLDTFGIGSQSELLALSRIQELNRAVRSVIAREKEEVLLRKPLNAILARCNAQIKKTEEEILLANNEIALLSTPNEDLEERQHNLSRVSKKMERKIETLGEDLGEVIDDIVRKGCIDMENAVDASCKRMNGIIDNWGKLAKVDNLNADLDREMQFLATRTLRRLYDDIARDTRFKIKRTLDDFFSEAEDVLTKLQSTDDFDPRDFVKSVSNKIAFDSDGHSTFGISGSDRQAPSVRSWHETALKLVGIYINTYTFGLAGAAVRITSHENYQVEAKRRIVDLQRNFKPREYLEPIQTSKEDIISGVKKAFIEELLTPIQQQLTDLETQSSEKEQHLQAARQQQAQLTARKAELTASVKEYE